MQSKRSPFQFPGPWTREFWQILQTCIWQALFNEQRAKIHAPQVQTKFAKSQQSNPILSIGLALAHATRHHITQLARIELAAFSS